MAKWCDRGNGKIWFDLNKNLLKWNERKHFNASTPPGLWERLCPSPLRTSRMIIITSRDDDDEDDKDCKDDGDLMMHTWVN